MLQISIFYAHNFRSKSSPKTTRQQPSSWTKSANLKKHLIKVIFVNNSGEIEKNNALKQKEMFTNLYKGFKARYDEELKKAQEVEK